MQKLKIKKRRDMNGLKKIEIQSTNLNDNLDVIDIRIDNTHFNT